MTEYLDFIKTKHLEKAIDDNAYNFQNEFPELMKLLIRATCGDNAYSRIPDDIEVGFDGVVNNSTKNSFVAKGLSVWEFGTDKEVRKKINKDYNKRTKNPRGVDKSNTVLYLCTPRKWPARSESIEKWKKAHSGDWKNVEILDAQIITDWLNKTPSVCAWFLEQFTKEKNINISTLDSAWEELVNRTNPVLKESFFDFGKEANSEIQNRIGKNKAITICANNKIDSYGFILRFLKLAGKEKVLVVYNKNILEKIQNVASEQIILCNFDTHEIMAKNGNCVITCCSMENKSGDSIVLPERDYAKTSNALVDSGIDAGHASDICQTTHLKTYAIMRKIKSDAYSEQYGWRRNAGEDGLLKALLCVQKCISAAQKEAIREISGLKTVEEVENGLEHLARIDDSPIIKDSRGNFALATPEEVAYTFIDDCNGTFFHRAHLILKEILDAIYNKTLWKGYHYYECNDLLDSLTTFYVYFSEYTKNKSSLIKKIEELLNHPIILCDKAIQESIIPHFCESAPELMLSYFNTNINKVIDKTIDKDVFIDSIKLLFESGHAEKSCLLAKEIYFNTKEEEVLEVLCMAICPFGNYPKFSIEKKKKLAISLIEESKKDMLFILNQLLKWDYYSPANKIIMGKMDKEPLSTTWNQCFDYYERVIDTCIEFSDKKLYFEILKIILKNLDHFKPDYLLKTMYCFDYSTFKYEEIAEIQLELIRQKSLYKKLNNKYTESLDTWFKLTVHGDPTFENIWLFNSYYHYVNYCFDDTMTLEEARDKTLNSRQKFFCYLRNNKPNNYIQILSNLIKDDYFWGVFIYQNDIKKIKNWVSILSKNRKTLVLAGLLDCLKEEDMKPSLEILNDEMRRSVINHMKNNIVCNLISEPEKELFWKNQEMGETYSESSYRNLLLYNPEGLIRYLLNNNNVERKNVIEVLKAINNSSDYNNIKRQPDHNCWKYIQILNRYTDDIDDELDSEVFELFINGKIHNSILQSNRFIFKNLGRIKDVIERRDPFHSNDLCGLRIPSELCMNIEQLKSIWSYIKNIDNNYNVFASIIINTIYLEDDDHIRRNFLEHIENYANQELLNNIKLKLDLLMTNGFYYNMSRKNLNIKKLLNNCNNLPKLQEMIKEAIKDNTHQTSWFEEKWNDDRLMHDPMRIIGKS